MMDMRIAMENMKKQMSNVSPVSSLNAAEF